MKARHKMIIPLLAGSTLIAVLTIGCIAIAAVTKAPSMPEFTQKEEVPVIRFNAAPQAQVYREAEKTITQPSLSTSATEQDNLEKLIDKIIEESLGEGMEEEP